MELMLMLDVDGETLILIRVLQVVQTLHTVSHFGAKLSVKYSYLF